MDALVLIFVAIFLMIIGVPIAASLCIGMITVSIVFDTINIQLIAQNLHNGVNSLPFLAIPGFMLAGIIMESGGVSRRIVGIANAFVGNLTGGLSAVVVIFCLFFGAISGSAAATAAAVGGMLIPSMVKMDYDKEYSAGICAVSGGLGVIIPPSISFVIYGCAVSISIGDLFLAGILPGVLCGALLIATGWFMSRRKGYKGTGHKFNAKEALLALKEGIWALFMPILILGGIYSGIFTATEASIVSVVYGIIISLFVYRNFTFKDLIKILYGFVSYAGGVLMPLTMGLALGATFSIMQVPTRVTALLMSISESPYVILLLVNIFLLIVGMLLDSPTALVILSPILFKALMPYGIDPIHLGVIMTVNLAIGFVTPPVGISLYICSSIAKANIEGVIKNALPFIGAMIIGLMIITYVPWLSLVFVK